MYLIIILFLTVQSMTIKQVLSLTFIHTTYGQMSLIYKGGTLWNNLRRNLKIIQSASLFKSKLMHYLRSLD